MLSVVHVPRETGILDVVWTMFFRDQVPQHCSVFCCIVKRKRRQEDEMR